MNVVALRNGVEKMRLNVDIHGDGTVWSHGFPLLDGEAPGFLALGHDKVVAASKAKRFSEIPADCFCRLGTNAGGLEVVTSEQADARAEARRAERHKKLLVLVPGLDEVRAARADEQRYHDQFQRMMDDENNDGVNPPRPVRESAESVAQRYPIAARYMLAESYSYANHYAKAGAGTRAVKRIEAGEDSEIVIREMEDMCWLLGEWDKPNDPRKGRGDLAMDIAEAKGKRVHWEPPTPAPETVDIGAGI